MPEEWSGDPGNPLFQLEEDLEHAVRVGREADIRSVINRADQLERAAPGPVKSFFTGDRRREKARKIRQDSLTHLKRLKRKGELYAEPPEAVAVAKRTRPDRLSAVPLYIDKHALLTLLAAREDGFSIMETRKVGADRSVEAARSLGLKFQIAPLDLLNVGPSASTSTTRRTNQTEESSRDVYQTEGSLLYQLLETFDEIPVVDGDTWEGIGDSHFVELHARLGPNPWVEYLNAQRRLVDIVEPLAELTGGAGRGNERMQTAKRIGGYRRFLDTALEALEQGGPLPLLGEIQLSSLGPLEHCSLPRVVVPVFPEYLRDPSLAEVTHGVVVVIGTLREKLEPPSETQRRSESPQKVARPERVTEVERHEVERWADRNIQLVPSALHGALADKGLETLFVAAEELSGEIRRLAALEDPEVEAPPIVRGPAVEVVPIAILTSHLKRSAPEPDAATARRGAW